MGIHNLRGVLTTSLFTMGIVLGGLLPGCSDDPGAAAQQEAELSACTTPQPQEAVEVYVDAQSPCRPWLTRTLGNMLRLPARDGIRSGSAVLVRSSTAGAPAVAFTARHLFPAEGNVALSSASPTRVRTLGVVPTTNGAAPRLESVQSGFLSFVFSPAWLPVDNQDVRPARDFAVMNLESDAAIRFPTLATRAARAGEKVILVGFPGSPTGVFTVGSVLQDAEAVRRASSSSTPKGSPG